jgi:competence protein ComFC
MRCINCQNLSGSIICKRCKKIFFKENINLREVDKVSVVSLFGYSEIESFITSKYKLIGYRIFKYFAKEHLKPFLESFEKNYNFPEKIYLIGVDEIPKENGYSHIATLTHYSQTKNIKAIHSSLIATSRVSYAKKSKEFRLLNSRKFIYKGPKDINAIIVDDLITTGSTISQAIKILNKNGVNILFAITLADAKR